MHGETVVEGNMDRSVLYAVISFSAAAGAYAALGFLHAYAPFDDFARTLQGIAGLAAIVTPIYFLRSAVIAFNRRIAGL